MNRKAQYSKGMNIISGIYKIHSIKKPNRFYIGSAVNIKKRKNNHLDDLRKNKHHSAKLQNHFNKYGESDLMFTILLGCNKEDLLRNEQFFIDSLRPFFNISSKAGSNLGYKFTTKQIKKLRISHLGNKSALGTRRSEEWKKRCSERQLGKKRHPHSLETIEKMKMNHRGMKGRKLSEEHKQKISLKLKGRKQTQEAIKNMSIAQRKYYLTHSGTRKGIVLSQETKRKMRLSAMGNKNFLGHTHSLETRQRLSKINKGNKNCLGRIYTKETIVKMSSARKLFHQRRKNQSLVLKQDCHEKRTRIPNL